MRNLLIVATVALYASTAWAECAWILWIENESARILERAPYLEKTKWWERENAFKTFEQCHESKKRVWTVIAKQYDDPSTFPGIEKVDKVPYEGVFITLKGQGGHWSRLVRCYPDTVDPRK